MKELAGKVMIVTGASRGIGRAIALEFARQGADVAFNYLRSEAEAHQVKQELESLGVRAACFRNDVGDLKSVREMVDTVKREFGRIDGLVNNAGLTRDKLLMSMSEEDWSEVIRVNLTGAFNLSRAAIFTMMKAKSGSILNVSSISGLVGMPGQVNYSASKAGLIGLTKALAKEAGTFNVRVNALALGFIGSDMTAALSSERRYEALKMIPLGRLGTVADVAPMAAFLMSEAASYITGTVVQIDGGLAM